MRYLIIMWLFLAGTAVAAESVQWAENWDMAAKKAAQEGKTIMAVMERQGCHYCVRMDEDVFKNPAIAQKINAHFVPVRLDIERDVGTYPARLRAMGTPTVFFVMTNGTGFVQKVIGYKPPMEFMGILDFMAEL